MGILRATGIWIVLAIAGIANGLIRDPGMRVVLGITGLKAHWISTLTGMIIFFVVVLITIPKLPYRTKRSFLMVGAYWVTLTIAFEFLFGRFVAGLSWGDLLMQYNIFRGYIWIAVLIEVMYLPLITARMHRLTE